MQEEHAPEKPKWTTPLLTPLVCLNEAEAGKYDWPAELGIGTLFTTSGTYHQAGPNS